MALTGPLTSKTDTVGTTDYVYDTLGNLLSVDPLGVDDKVGYSIDVLGNRVARAVNGVVTNRWVYGGGISPLAEADPATGAVLRRYVYGTHTNVPDYMVDYSGASQEVYAFVHDHCGSVRRVMNVATGAVAQAIDYDESGRVLSDTNPGFQPFGFAGGLYDPATGLTRFGLRDYDSYSGRWTAMDPIGFNGGMNFYGYVVGDPVNYVDPLGLSIMDALANGNPIQRIGNAFIDGARKWAYTGNYNAPDSIYNAGVDGFGNWAVDRSVIRGGSLGVTMSSSDKTGLSFSYSAGYAWTIDSGGSAFQSWDISRDRLTYSPVSMETPDGIKWSMGSSFGGSYDVGPLSVSTGTSDGSIGGVNVGLNLSPKGISDYANITAGAILDPSRIPLLISDYIDMVK